VFAPNSKHRARVTPTKRGRGGQHAATGDREEPTPAERRASMTWSQRLKRVFGIDIETCPACGGAVRILACIEDPEVIEKILNHLEANVVEPEASRRPLAWWPARGEMRASGAVVGRVQGLKCRAGPLLRSGRRPTWGADGRKEGLPPDEKAVYPSYTQTG
jgi:hypothetical protein